MTQSSRPQVKDILAFYESILNSLSLEANEAGLISMDVGGTLFASEINGKRMVLPTHDVLRAAPWETQIAFHPLAENVYRGESPVLKKLKTLVNFRLTSVLNLLIVELAQIAANKEYHEKLTPKQSELLDFVPKINGKTVDAFVKVLNTVSVNGDHRLVNIYLKHGGKYKGEDHSRVAVTYFPVTEEFNNDDKSIFGVKLPSQKDFKAFQSLFDFIVPDNSDTEVYSYGSRSMEAPYFDALMHAYVKVAKQLNKITWLFRKHLEAPDEMHIDVKWADSLKDLSFFRGLIPGLQGNDGELSIDEQEKAKLEEKVVRNEPTQESSVFQKPAERIAAPMPPPPVSSEFQSQTPPWEPEPVAPPQPQAQPQAPAPSEGEGLSWNEVMARRQQQQQPAQPQAQAWQQPAQMPPAQPWQQPQVAPGPPPGFAGTNYTPPQMQQPVNPGGYANHPRNPQYQAQQQPWQQNFPRQGGGYAQPPGGVYGSIV